jgi:hypothetical protein
MADNYLDLANKKTDIMRKLLGADPSAYMPVPKTNPEGIAPTMAMQGSPYGDTKTILKIKQPAYRSAPTNIGEARIPPNEPVMSSTSPAVTSYLKKKNGIAPLPVEEPTKPEDHSMRDLGIILAGGLSSFGAGIQGQDQSRANDQMMHNLASASANDQMKIMKDPNSQESKQAQKIFKDLYGSRVKMPANMTAQDFKEKSPYFDKILQRQMMTERSGASKKSDSKISNEYRDHLAAMDSSQQNRRSIQKLNRNPLGSFLPDMSAGTNALASDITKNAYNEAKAVAGVGTFSESDYRNIMPTVANSNERSGIALEKNKNVIYQGAEKSLAKLQRDYESGAISPEDYNRYANEYDNHLQQIGYEVGANGRIVPIKGK